MSQHHDGTRPLSQYDIFVSYSWGGGRLAESIQRGLQRIARPWYKRAIIRDRQTEVVLQNVERRTGDRLHWKIGGEHGANAVDLEPIIRQRHVRSAHRY